MKVRPEAAASPQPQAHCEPVRGDGVPFGGSPSFVLIVSLDEFIRSRQAGFESITVRRSTPPAGGRLTLTFLACLDQARRDLPVPFRLINFLGEPVKRRLRRQAASGADDVTNSRMRRDAKTRPASATAGSAHSWG